MVSQQELVSDESHEQQAMLVSSGGTITFMLSTDRTALINYLTDAIVRCGGAVSNSAIREDTTTVKQRLSKFSDTTLKGIFKYIAEDESAPKTNSIGRLVHIDDSSETLVNECLTFFPHIPLGNRRKELIEILHKYPQLPDTDDFSVCDDEVKAKVIALLTVTVTVLESSVRNTAVTTIRTPQGRYASFINDSDLTLLIVNRHEDADRIAQLIIERNTNDAQRIASFLDFHTPSLGTGVL